MNPAIAKMRQSNDLILDSLKAVPLSNVISNHDHTFTEGFHAKRKPGDGKSSVVKHKPGARRRGRSMGRYPFLAQANKYLEAYGSNYAETTRDEYKRRYRRMDKDMRALVKSKRMTSMEPRNIDAEDVLAYVTYLRSKETKEDAICHDISALRSLLVWLGNTAVDNFRMRYKSANPRRKRGGLPPLGESEYMAILRASERVADDDWKLLRAYTLVLLSICAGLRTKELRFCRVQDLNTSEWMLHTERVKGEDTYGKPRDIPIWPEACRILTRYLRVRNELVMRKCPGNAALFPALGNRKKDLYMSSNGLQQMKMLVQKDAGVRFDLRKCRRTFCQTALDEGMLIESVSRLMGHSSTRTTEEYYGRRKQELAIKEAKQLMRDKTAFLSPGAKPPLIDSKYEVTGYA